MNRKRRLVDVVLDRGDTGWYLRTKYELRGGGDLFYHHYSRSLETALLRQARAIEADPRMIERVAARLRKAKPK